MRPTLRSDICWAVVISLVAIGITSFFLSKACEAKMGISLYSGYYSTAHVIGVFGEYTKDYDIEYGGYMTNNDADNKTGRTAFLIQGNLKTQMSKYVDLLYGLSFELFTDGQSNGVEFTGVGYGPYIGIERRLDDNIRLRVLYHPVYITTLESGGVKTTTTDFGLNGAFGLSYIF